jgi:hypothetical protein
MLEVMFGRDEIFNKKSLSAKILIKAPSMTTIICPHDL